MRHRVAYLDLTLSAPKHVSLGWSFAKTEAERNALLQAHRTARDETLRYVERQVIRGRLGAGGSLGHERARAAWITVEHYTARPTQERICTDPTTGETYTELTSAKVAGDPALHSHCLVPNLIRTESGRYAAIDTAAFHGRIHEFGAIYQGILERELTKLNVKAEIDPRTNTVRLPAIPEMAVDEFSKRSREGEAAARKRAVREGRDWDAMTPEQQATFKKAGTHATRLDKETNTPDWDAWRQQAQRIGWTHGTVIEPQPLPVRSRAERFTDADRFGLEFLSDMLARKAVLGQGEVRLAIARGFIAAGGLESADDIGLMAKHWAQGTVMQDGQETKLIWKEVEPGKIKLTTELHRDQEAEFIALAREAIADRRHALTSAEIAAAVERAGFSYRGRHGNQQRAAIETAGTEGGLSVVLGVAGAGKTTGVLSPLVDAWKARGLEDWGTAQAWRQAKDLRSAGIHTLRIRALDPFLTAAHDGRIRLGNNSVVVLDEVGRIGTVQVLDLLRLRQQHGFKLVLAGDDEQGQSIQAGPVIDLLRRALGEERIPKILTTIRQDAENERALANMFRRGEVADAIRIKRADGTAELVPGGYRDAVARIADLYMERRQATRDRPRYRITISAPTHADAREIARQVRERRRDMGEIGPDLASVAV
ncbi:MAG TPA: MobF family relaxase, partial [Rhodopila sp.]